MAWISLFLLRLGVIGYGFKKCSLTEGTEALRNKRNGGCIRSIELKAEKLKGTKEEGCALLYDLIVMRGIFLSVRH